MYILGINISHHSSTCLLKDGEILFFLEDDRLTRKKLYGYQEFFNSINDHDIITPYFPALETVKKYTNQIDYIIFSSYGQEGIDEKIIKSITKKIEEGGIKYKSKIFYHENHHIYHASNAFYASGFKDAVALVMDGGGSYDKDFYYNNIKDKYEYPFREIETIFRCSYDNGIQPLFKHNGLLDPNLDHEEIYIVDKSKPYEQVYTHSNSCGNLFSILSYFFNTGDDSAGKVMGLSSYGNLDYKIPGHVYDRRDPEKKEKILEEEFFYNFNNIWVTDPSPGEFIEDIMNALDTTPFINPENIDKTSYEFYQYSNIAKKVQEQTEKQTVRLIQKAIDISGSKNVVLSGGYFLNCVNNYKYLEHFPDVNFFIDPISHDAGTALGAAKWFHHGVAKDKTIRPLKNLYLG